MRRRAVAALAGVLAVGLAACSSDGEPAAAAPSTPDVCASADQLRTSLDALREARPVQDGAAALEQSWETVQGDWTRLGEDARAQHADRVDEVQTAADGVPEALAAAKADPSGATLSDAAAAVAAFASQAGALVDEVGSTC